MKSKRFLNSKITSYGLILLSGICGYFGSSCNGYDPEVVIDNVPESLSYEKIGNGCQFDGYEFALSGTVTDVFEWDPREYCIRFEITLCQLSFSAFGLPITLGKFAQKILDCTNTSHPSDSKFSGSKYWDGTFDTWFQDITEENYPRSICVRVGFARYEIGQPIEYFEQSYSQYYHIKITEEEIPIGPSYINIHSIQINYEMKNTLSWDELYNANTKKIEVHYYYFRNPDEPHCDKIRMQITQIDNTEAKYSEILVDYPIKNHEQPEIADWNGKLKNENNEPVFPDPKGTPKLKFEIGFVDEDDPDLWIGVPAEYPIDITGVSFIPPEISFSYGTVNPLYFDFDANQGDFLVNIFINAPVDVNSKIWFEFGPGGKYKSNEVVTTNYITHGQFYNVPIFWGGYTNSLLNDCSGPTILKAYLKYTKTYPVEEPQEIEIQLNVQGGNSYPTEVTVEVDQYSGLNASALIKEDLVNNAFAPLDRLLRFNYHETVFDFKYEEVQRPDEDEDWEPGQVPEDEAVAVIQEYKNNGRNMYVFLTKGVHTIDKAGKKKLLDGLYVSPPYNGAIVTTRKNVTMVTIRELGRHITHGVFTIDPDHTVNGVWDSGCVMPEKAVGVGKNTSFNRKINPHFCRICIGKIGEKLIY